MPKPKTIYTCKACGNRERQWYGKCTKCWNWNTFTEKTIGKKKPTGEKELFDDIWEDRVHKSFISGKPLDQYHGTDFYVNMFAHVLAKGKYPKFRLEPENIVLLTPEEHTLLDHGTIAQRKKYSEENLWVDWDKLFEHREYLKEKYNQLHK